MKLPRSLRRSLRRFDAALGAPFRAMARLESRERLSARLDPGVERSPLVAAARLEPLAEAHDGGAALARGLDRLASGAVGGDGENRRAVAAGVDAEPGAARRVGRDLPIPRRARSPRWDAAATETAPAAPGAADGERLAAILEEHAPGIEGAASGSRSGAGRRDGGAASLERGNSAGLPSWAAPGGGSRRFLHEAAAHVPVLRPESEALVAALLAGVGANCGGLGRNGGSTVGSSGAGDLGRLAPVPTDEGGKSPIRDASRRAGLTLPSPVTVGSGIDRPREGGLRGLAALAEAAGPIPVPSAFAAPPSVAPTPLDRRFGPAGADEPFGLRSERAPLSSGDEPDSFAGALLGGELEAALDRALRRAARRHGIEVLEP